MARDKVEAFPCWLASERDVAPSTHNQALSALLFLYQKVLRISLPWIDEVGRPRAQRRLPVVMSHDEVSRVLGALAPGPQRLLAELLYGTGMRLMEGLRLRTKDIDFDRRAIVVRHGKAGKDRVVVLLPPPPAHPLSAQQPPSRHRLPGVREPEPCYAFPAHRAPSRRCLPTPSFVAAATSAS